MKTLSKTLFTALILILALTIVLGFDGTGVADASDGNVTKFAFDYLDGEFTLTEQSTSTVVYRKPYFSDVELLEAIKFVVGADGEYDLILPAPEVEVALSGGNDTEVYSADENKFSFTAEATHKFEELNMVGFSTVGANGYTWKFSRNNGAETEFAGHGDAVEFGKNHAFGTYGIFAYATVKFEFDGKTFTATGKSTGIEVEITKATASDVEIDDRYLVTSGHVYGMTVAEIIDSVNVPGRGDYKIELAEDVEGAISGSTVLDACSDNDQYYGILVYFSFGQWNGNEFTVNESIDKVLVSLSAHISRREVRILMNNVNINEGDDLDYFGENLWQYIPTPPTGVSAKELGISFHIETEDGMAVDLATATAGVYYIRGSYTNTKNFDVIFLDYENKDKNDYSRRAVLTIRPSVLAVSDDNFIYSVKNIGGHFEIGDELILTDGADGGKTLKIYNGVESVEYDNLSLTIERKDASVKSVMLYVNGQWKEYFFDENGKITVSYSTINGNANSFGIKMTESEESAEDGDDDNTAVIVGAVLGTVAGLLCVILPIVFILRKKKQATVAGDTSVADETEKHEETADDAVASEDHRETDDEEAPLTLEEKYALHPEFVPTPTVEDAFKGVEAEDIVDDEKEVDESAEDGKITFKSKILSASVENRAIYNALKNNLLSYKGIKSRVVNGGDYFRRPGKQIVKIIFIGKTLRLALALNPDDYDYNVYHQKNRSTMKKYADTPMFVKVQSLLGVRRALKLISDLMEKEGIKPLKKVEYDDYIYNLTYEE